MRRFFPLLLFVLAASFLTDDAVAQKLEKIKYGDFSGWVTRHIDESKIIGGKRKTIYEIAPNQTITGAKPYVNVGGSPWGTSNVYAHVSGITKASGTVEPFDRGGGNRCARLMAKMEHVKVAGVINMDVMAAGSIFLGQVNEPVTGTKSPFSKIAMGMPFTRRPKALVYDYKLDMPAVNTRVKATGLSPKKTLQGRDNAEVYILLQRRWEDDKGNIYAKRVGTGRERFSASSSGWVNGHRLKVHYGDITSQSFYRPWMGLLSGAKAYYAKNSKGKLVPVQEIGWDDANATPTHVLVMASSSCGEPFVGTEGITLYVDNFAFEY